MLSPPSSRWSPTAMRVRRGPLSRSSTAISVRSVVPPPTSTTSASRTPASAVGERVAVAIEPVVERRLRLFEQAHAAAGPRARAASSVSARAASSNDAGTVSTTSCGCERVLGMRGVPGARACARGSSRWRPPGESFGTSSGAPHGRIGALAIDAGVAQPALGAGDQPARHLAAERLRQRCRRRRAAAPAAAPAKPSARSASRQLAVARGDSETTAAARARRPRPARPAAARAKTSMRGRAAAPRAVASVRALSANATTVLVVPRSMPTM